MAGKVIRGVAGLNRTLNRLPKVAQARLRDEAEGIASSVAEEATRRARSGSRGVVRVARYVDIRAARDRVPVVRMSGARMLPPRNGRARSGPQQTVAAVMWGAEYGSSRSPQFSPWGGNGGSAGYFLWPSVRMDDIEERYAAALEQACKAA